MSVGPISYPGLPNYPSQPSMNAACCYLLLSGTGEIAGQIAAAGASAVSATPPPTATPNADLQAYADLAEIDLYLKQHPGTSFNDPFLAGIIANLQAQSQSCDPSVQALITAAQATFSVSGTTVTFTTSNNQTNFSTWWTQGSNGGQPGLTQVMNGLSQLIANSQLQPSVSTPSSPNSPDTPAVFINLCMIYADAMQYPSTNPNGILDNEFWGNSAGTTSGMTFGQVFPYALAMYEYQMEFNEPGGGQSMGELEENIQNLIHLLPDPNSLNPPNPTNYNAMYNLISNPLNGIALFHPAFWPSSMQFYFNNPSDLSTFYGILLDPLYDAFMNIAP